MDAQPDLFDAVAQPKWAQPKARGGCKRDLSAGPGSCWYWWEGCPKAVQRSCHAHWLSAQLETLK